jgi:drug/metabolite transporter (DMT)-like permease
MSKSTEGWGNGLLGIIIFSGSLPATRAGVAGFTPLFLTSARAVIAALLGATFLLAYRQARPMKSDLLPLLIVAIGAVIGFPLLTGLALKHITAAHSVVFVGLLPLSTASFAVLRGGERPRLPFWIFSAIGAATVMGFALMHGRGGSAVGDLLMLAAIALCGLGYAEGANLSRKLGGWQVISWALLLAFPIMLMFAVASLPTDWHQIGVGSWIGLAYVSAFSQLIGFIFWYRGLALGGIAGVGQLQLLQPFLGLSISAALLGEPVAWTMIGSSSIIVFCVAAARRFA